MRGDEAGVSARRRPGLRALVIGLALLGGAILSPVAGSAQQSDIETRSPDAPHAAFDS